jgi:hypothetical protein
MLKYLRIAVTALSLAACVLLIALWVRSLTRGTTLQGVLGSERLQFTSENGRLAVLIFPNIQSRNFPRRDWTITSSTSRSADDAFDSWQVGTMQPKGVIAVVPWWFVVLILVALAAAPWIKWRFSLRTLLVATTLVAVGLGVVIAAT